MVALEVATIFLLVVGCIVLVILWSTTSGKWS